MQAANAKICFCPELWPEFSVWTFYKCVIEYQRDPPKQSYKIEIRANQDAQMRFSVFWLANSTFVNSAASTRSPVTWAKSKGIFCENSSTGGSNKFINGPRVNNNYESMTYNITCIFKIDYFWCRGPPRLSQHAG